MLARYLWSIAAIFVIAGSISAEPAESPSTSSASIIEPPDILNLDGVWLSLTTWGIVGEHLVREDGTIALGAYGRLYVTGLTPSQAQSAIGKHLSKRLKDPHISVSIATNDSKVCYVIIRNRDSDQISHFPITGRETVLDAIAEINGLPALCLKRKVWVVRPNAKNVSRCEILPVNWKEITQFGATKTNYHLFPGDQIHVAPQPPTTSIGAVHSSSGATTSAVPPQ